MRNFVRCHTLTALCIIALMLFTTFGASAYAAPADSAQVAAEAAVPTVQQDADSAAVVPVEIAEGAENSGGGLHKILKEKFIEGNASFMSLVALALVLGLAFCIERIIYLSMSEINAKKFMREIDAKIEAGDIEGAKTQCRNTRGPVASICYQGLLRVDTTMEDIERSVAAYGSVQAANLEKGCSWITLFIAMAPSLGDWHGDGVRADTDCGRHQSYYRGCGYEGGAHHHYLRYHCGAHPAAVLQLCALEGRPPHGADGGERYHAARRIAQV